MHPRRAVVDEQVIRVVGQARALPQGDGLAPLGGVDRLVAEQLADARDVGRDVAHEAAGRFRGRAPVGGAVLGGDGLPRIRALMGIYLVTVGRVAVDGVEGEAHRVAIAGGRHQVGRTPPVVPAVGVLVLVLGELQVALALTATDRRPAPRRRHRHSDQREDHTDNAQHAPTPPP